MGEGTARRVRGVVGVPVAVAGVVGVLVAALPVVAGAAGAGSLPRQPLAILSASLTQDGQDLVWQVEAGQPFSPGALPSDHRSVCLLIEQGSKPAVTSQVCLVGPAPGEGSPRLLYSLVMPAGPGPAVAIQATVTRSSDQEVTASFVPSSVGLQYRPLLPEEIAGLRKLRYLDS